MYKNNKLAEEQDGIRISMDNRLPQEEIKSPDNKQSRGHSAINIGLTQP